MAYIAESGIAFTHYGVFEQLAHALNRVIVVRNTNPLSTPWIDLGYPPKPRSIKIHTSHQTGKATCVNADEIQKARAQGFYRITASGFGPPPPLRRYPAAWLPIKPTARASHTSSQPHPR